MKVHFITAVWGKDHRDTYLNTVLPNHLSKGNLGCFRGDPECLFDLYTSAEDIPRITSHPAFLAVKEIMQVRVTQIDNLVGSDHDHKHNVSLMTKCFRLAIQRANERGAGFFVFTADQVYSDGTFRKARERALAGARAVLIMSMRLNKELFEPRFQKLFFQQDNTLLAPAREMVRLGLDTLHPISNSYFVNSNEHNQFPSSYFWGVDDEGLIARSLSMHPLYMNPVDKTALPARSVDDDYILKACPSFQDIYIVTDTDEMAAFEMTNGDFRYGQGMGGRHKFDIYDCAVNIRSGRNRYHRLLFRRSVFIHHSDFTPKCREVEREVDAVALQARETLASIYTRNLYPAIFPQKTKIPGFDHVKRVAVFGVGRGGKETLNLTNRCGWEISHYIDNATAKRGLTFQGAPVVHPDDPGALDCDLVIVASVPGKTEIFGQLKEKGLFYRRNFIYYRDTVKVGNCDITLTIAPTNNNQPENANLQ